MQIDNLIAAIIAPEVAEGIEKKKSNKPHQQLHEQVTSHRLHQLIILSKQDIGSFYFNISGWIPNCSLS